MDVNVHVDFTHFFSAHVHSYIAQSQQDAMKWYRFLPIDKLLNSGEVLGEGKSSGVTNAWQCEIEFCHL